MKITDILLEIYNGFKVYDEDFDLKDEVPWKIKKNIFLINSQFYINQS